jgi:3-hydroxyisobutyrate dehydrogenase-like beta-hydroxyacid dehydrogenase
MLFWTIKGIKMASGVFPVGKQEYAKGQALKACLEKVIGSEAKLISEALSIKAI